jgi:hypothetical protein
VFILLGGLANAVHEEFKSYTDTIMPFLFKALQSWEEYEASGLLPISDGGCILTLLDMHLSSSPAWRYLQGIRQPFYSLCVSKPHVVMPNGCIAWLLLDFSLFFHLRSSLFAQLLVLCPYLTSNRNTSVSKNSDHLFIWGYMRKHRFTSLTKQMAIKSEFKPYLEVVMALLKASTASLIQMQFQETDDYEQIEFLNLLRQALAEAYQGIFQGLGFTERNKESLPV